MHPQVHSPRFISCHELVEALEKCHQNGFSDRIFGKCNNQKEALSACLHEARMEQQKQLILKSKEKQKVIRDKWKKTGEEEYGEEEFLKKLLQREQAKRGN